MRTQKGKVFVGLSGGVDSSVAAARLKDEGYDVTGVFIKVWHPDFLPCQWERERLDAMRVAATLGIPFLTCDAETAYRDEVAAYFIESYKNGLTPNPDVMCNRAVKFGVFYQFAKRHGADFIATGHYAGIQSSGGPSTLMRGTDTKKDQSYFLWNIPKAVLPHVLLPLGESRKDEVRQEAADRGLPTAHKRDSQGICFLGHVDIKDFLSHYVPMTPGMVVDTTGAVIGEHPGAIAFTIGQRHGFTLTNANGKAVPHYVIKKDLISNTITVAPEPAVFKAGSQITLRQLNLLGDIETGKTYDIQFRYRQTPIPGTIEEVTGEAITITLNQIVEAAALGQSCVLYDKVASLGGGILTECPTAY